MGFYFTIDDRGKVLLSKGIRVHLANLRKRGVTPDVIGNAGLKAGENVRAVSAMVAYAAAVKNPAKVNQYWGA